ncbi:MAG: hypothetical protein DMG31_14855 [Acidobacteria bacterium]|nr:MAG: hypothetical protein DMG31_14855 [Acidobacteriota bacterium]
MIQSRRQCALVSREAMRFPLDAPVVFWWRDANGVHQQGEGRSYDLSELGAFVFASACPPEGAQVGLRIPITQFPDVARPLRMEMEGRVLRIEQVRSGEGRDGFAILSVQTVLCELDNRTRQRNSDLPPKARAPVALHFSCQVH